MKRPFSQKAERQPAVIAFVQNGLDHYRHGRTGEAGAALLAALELDPGSFDALHMLALVRHAEGRNPEALELIDKALRVDRGAADALANRGAILQSLRRYDEALASCGRALVMAPRHVNALNNRGNALEKLGRFSESLASYDKALAYDPRNVLALANRANPLQRLHRFEEALASCERALALAPRTLQALVNRANALQRLHRFEAAVAGYDDALAIDPDHVGAWTNRGIALESLGRLDDALTSHERAMTLDPRRSGAWSNRGNALLMLGRIEEALTSVDAALALDGTSTGAWRNRGNVLCELGRYGEAHASYRRADTPSHPDNGEVEFADGLLSLLEGDFSAGWRKYESRWRTMRSTGNPFAARAPQWSGAESLAGRTILLHSDAGLGDAIQFVRYVPMVAERAAKVLLAIEPALAPLRLPLADNVTLIDRGAQTPGFDTQCPLSSLPLAFGTDLTSIPPAPYISAPPGRTAAWAQRLPRAGKRVGLAWAGNPAHRRDRMRSIALPLLAPLLRVPDTVFVSLQRDLRPGDDAVLRAHPNVTPLGEALDDFADIAAVVSELDLIVTIDSSVAHLAGAIGRPVWILLPFHPDWRWLLGRDDSPWYPSARLFRQAAIDDWASVIERVAAALHEVMAETPRR
jgi:tetratricopeptide (TPR) repeat protein